MAFLDGVRIAGEWPSSTIQQAIDEAAGSDLAVLVPSTYRGNDTFVNPSSVPIIDLRPAKCGGTGLNSLGFTGDVISVFGITFSDGSYLQSASDVSEYIDGGLF